MELDRAERERASWAQCVGLPPWDGEVGECCIWAPLWLMGNPATPAGGRGQADREDQLLSTSKTCHHLPEPAGKI